MTLSPDSSPLDVLRYAKRIHVVGSSGSGKTTFSCRLAQLKGLAFIELDEINHGPLWTERSRDSFRDELAHRLDLEDEQSGGWVIDGNYFSRASDIYDGRVDCVVWLDFSRAVTMRRLVWRSIKRVFGRQELWNGNRERVRNLLSFDPHESVIVWSWTNFDRYRQRHESMARQDMKNRWVVLRSPKESDAVIRRLSDESGRSNPRLQ